MLRIVVHGGAGGTSRYSEIGCQLAAEAGIEVLRRGGNALDAVIAAVQWMEESGRFNAGRGSILRYDGRTIEMDAVTAYLVGINREVFIGAVGAVRNVLHPVKLARLVGERTSHHLLVGEGAERLAREFGLEQHPGPTRRAQTRFRALKRAIEEGRARLPEGMILEDLQALWKGIDSHSDTVGAVALDDSGGIAIAASTGGSGLMRFGRIGDTPQRGSGWEVGPQGGVLATGIGEAIVRREASQQVYARMARSDRMSTPQLACEQVVSLFPPDVPVGLIALSSTGEFGIASNCKMDTHFFTS